MPPKVLALGLDPAAADPAELTGLAPELVRSFIDAQLERLGAVGYEVTSCFVDRGATAEAVVSLALQQRRFDCVMFGAGLRAPAHLLLFEKLLNLIHAQAPRAKLCFNTTPADTAEAVQRWVQPHG
jgi:hypothetical protein